MKDLLIFSLFVTFQLFPLSAKDRLKSESKLLISGVCQNVESYESPLSRTEKIARARNIVLSAARDPKFADFEYLIKVDLDSAHAWPVEEVLKTIHSHQDWDCVSANDHCLEGLIFLRGGNYRDRIAFRDERDPLGPEMMGNIWWKELMKTWFKIN